MKDIPIDVANFCGLVVATLMYGLFLAMFASTIGPLWRHRHQMKFVLTVIISLVVITTINAGLMVAKNYEAFIKFREGPGGVVGSFQTLRAAMNPGTNVFLPFAGVLADTLICWRLYIIWSRRWWIVAFPIILLVAESIAALTGCITSSLQSKRYGSHRSAFPAGDFIVGACTVIVNLFCSPLIIGRLYWLGRDANMPDTRRIFHTTIIRLAESGALFTLTTIVWTCFTIVPEFPGIWTFIAYVYAMVVGIAPMLIVMHLNATVTSGLRDIEPGDAQGLPRPSLSTIAFRPQTSGASLQLDRWEYTDSVQMNDMEGKVG
ncbi:hypothetical protein FRB95_010497 [Tulasnella sp. JGI-2019a]|nr:hypothetical protein FRB93_008913 [Tulasnella sp. JGI-2019a]KAG9025152.1 hypothetical protein FRB95_010497 [Tulasnella sp. JGI-2019a]